MGRLTDEVFNESCCDGGECTPRKQSARSCGCDPGANWVCERHQQAQPFLTIERARALNGLTKAIHAQNHLWWTDLDTGQPIQRNVGEMLMLVVSEIAEAMEGHRKALMDDKLPHRSMLEVELADALIRIFDIGGGLGLDLGGALVEKLEYNASRADHTREGRLAPGGKKY